MRYAIKFESAKTALLPGQPLPASPPPLSPSASSSTLIIDDIMLSLDAFSAFLLSSDNSAFMDQHGKIYHDMTRPLCDYFISSSHNTYLVGNQVMGDSTIEGYIRALLQGCRSVECKLISQFCFPTLTRSLLVDIYDGDSEPMVFHGKTLTSKVPVREVCEAIAKYAFVTSPYPIIISAEIRCSVPQQDIFAMIVHKVFGEALVSTSSEGHPTIDKLPSPEDLKGRVLVKVCVIILDI